jgi:hypothetical protein
MTSTARRRWSREISSEVDGIAFQAGGPVLVHGYDPPAGGMWIDDVIPSQLWALDRHTGDILWKSPCEVGYGRGFAAGFGPRQEIVLLGPGLSGHRIVQMEQSSGQLVAAEPIPPFDEGLVGADFCVGLTPTTIFGIRTAGLIEAWSFSQEGRRFHHLTRSGQRVLVVFSDRVRKRQGVLALDVSTGRSLGDVLSPNLPLVHGIAVHGDELALLTADLQRVLPPELSTHFITELALRDEEGGLMDTLSLLAISASAEPGEAPLWYEILSTQPADEVPEVGVTADSGKLYLVRGAMLEVRDILTGRMLGHWTVPGLDERIALQVAEGAGLLAEEHRVSVFELPA